MRGYWQQLGDATSQWFGSATSYTRNANESISAATVRRGHGRFEAFIDLILGEDHCELAKHSDEARAADLLREAGWRVEKP